MSVAAFKAGAAHPRRQKHREMPPPGASAPAFAATVEPESMQERVLKVACCVHRFLISGSDLGIDARFSRFTATCVHRFLISGPNLRIDARFSRFTATCVHRFLILGGQFGNRCMVLPGNSLVAAAILDFRPRFANHCSTIVAAVWNGPPAAVVAAEMVRVRF